MPFFKTHEVLKEFSNIFLNDTTKKPIEGDNRDHFMLPVQLHTGETKDFLVRYYKRSGESAVEDLMEYYPCIIIQDFQPELDKTKLWGRSYIEGIHDSINGTTEKITLPLPLSFKFQVSVVTGRLKEIHGASDWFFSKFNFESPDSFLFNKLDTEEGPVGDVIPYMADFGEVPRDDRRFEYVFDYSFDIPLHARYKKYTYDEVQGYVGGNFEDALMNIVVALNTLDYSKFKETVKENFTIDDPTITYQEGINAGFVTKNEFENHKINPNTHLNLILDGGVNI